MGQIGPEIEVIEEPEQDIPSDWPEPVREPEKPVPVPA